ncbi:MAG: response regulator [Desulfobulbaceae bacterium]|nr:response regulator [Desulfobulbaceae bacterium]
MKRILVIDDDTQIREMLREILVKEGYEVAVAENGKDAIAIQQASPCDVIITDLIMPEQDGVETIMEFIQKDPTAKIIAISGGGRIGPRDYLEMAEALGAKKTFYKPFKRQDILTAVKELLTS